MPVKTKHEQVRIKRQKVQIPTYLPGEPNTLPFFLEKKAYQGSNGRVYPIPFTDKLSNTPVNKDYNAVIIENEHIKVILLPEIGGKVHGAIDKHNGYEFVYQNTVIKPAMIGMAGPWVSGGIEFNWPLHHRPTTYLPLEATVVDNRDGSKTCWMGEADRFYRMRSAVGITLYEGKSILEAKVVIYNRTDTPLPFLWWNNLSVRVHSQYKAIFPPDVEYVCDHDRRAVISFPFMKGIYQTARPYDYGEGVDGTWFSNIKLPTSVFVMRNSSKMDFLGGYDFLKDAGTITVADHHISVGKKVWTWGDGPFGKAWFEKLTDNGDRYIELMTGVYSDNQPDFTYIMPGETKMFTQVYYPIHGIGEVKNATREGALSFEIKGNELTIGVITTSLQEDATLQVKAGSDVIYREIVSVSPENCVIKLIPIPSDVPDVQVKVSLFDKQGRELVSYQPVEPGKKSMPEPRTIPPEPKDVKSLEELYLHGKHLEQYNHHTYEPEAYYREALNRDSMDLRCNHALGNLLLNKGDYKEARKYLTRAVKRIKMRNDNPEDTGPIYSLARLARLEGNFEEAYDLYQAAAWQYAWRSCSYYEIACIDCLKGNRSQAINYLRMALETNVNHFAAKTLLGYLTKDVQLVNEVLEKAPQDTFARFALMFLNGRTVEDFVLERAEDVIDVALDFVRAGLKDEAKKVLLSCTKPTQMIFYHLAFITGEKPKHTDITFCFPNRLEDIPVLQVEEWQAKYLLGCLYYDRLNYEAAIEEWEKSAKMNPQYAYTFRNLAQAYGDHRYDLQKAHEYLNKAFELDPANSRILYELLQLKKNSGVSVKERLALLEANKELAFQRDDCYLDWIILYTQDEQYEKARQLMLKKRFNIYEGGEGKLTKHHGWLYTLSGRKAHLEGRYEDACRYYEQALLYPANYGEGRHYSAQEANIYYFTGLLHESMGNKDKAISAYTAAVNQPDHLTEISYFAALAHEKLGNHNKAKEIYKNMLAEGQQKLKKAHLPGYFGVGMSAPLPFELDIDRINRIDAYILIALGAKGLKDKKSCREALKEIDKLDPTNPTMCFMKKLDVF